MLWVVVLSRGGGMCTIYCPRIAQTLVVAPYYRSIKLCLLDLSLGKVRDFATKGR